MNGHLLMPVYLKILAKRPYDVNFYQKTLKNHLV